MIGFNDVVQVFAGPVFCLDGQLALPLQPANCFRAGAADTEQDDLNGKTPTLEDDPSSRPRPLAA